MVKRLNAILVAAGLLCAAQAFSWYDPNVYGSEAPYEGKIVVSNHSTFRSYVGIRGNQCKSTVKVEYPRQVSQVVTVAHNCQELFLRHGETRTFYLNEANMKGSNQVWLEMTFPDSLDPSKKWICFDHHTRRYVKLGNDTFHRGQTVFVEIRESYSSFNDSVSCDIRYN